jgi:hypothetical protein
LCGDLRLFIHRSVRLPGGLLAVLEMNIRRAELGTMQDQLR